MNRIQQILSKAERDGTARRVATVDEPMIEERPPLTGPREIARTRAREAMREASSESARDRDGSRPEARQAELRRPPSEAAPIRDAAPISVAAPIDEAPPIEPVAYSDAPAAGQAADVVLHPLLIAAVEPHSSAAEHYRSLRSRIAQLERDRAVRVVQITSPGKGDGKTVTALNLALTMAQEFQGRVLLIDADLRHPRVHELLGIEPGPGLVDVLTGSATLQDALVDVPSQHLTVLRAGRAYDRPAEMLGSAPMRRLVDSLRAQFDRIVIDSAPAVVVDPAVLAAAVDGLLLVVRSGVTTKPAIARAIGALGSPKLLGLVFNESDAPIEEPYAARA